MVRDYFSDKLRIMSRMSKYLKKYATFHTVWSLPVIAGFMYTTRYIPVHFMYRAEFQLVQGKQYSTNADYMRQNMTVRRMNYPLLVERNWVLATNLTFLIPISLQLDQVNLRYFKLRLFYPTEFIVWNINMPTTLGCTDIKIKNKSWLQELSSFMWILQSRTSLHAQFYEC